MKRPMTPRGYNLLRREVQSLKAMRPELAKAIEVARGHGDLSENADYDAAKERSGMIEAKIRDIETRLSHADVIDPRKITMHSRVVFGLSARVTDLDSDEERIIHIVGSEESDVNKGLISYESPLGKALIGKEVGDDVQVQLPGGSREYEILEIFVGYSIEEEIIVTEDND